jgi:hypothetical protein
MRCGIIAFLVVTLIGTCGAAQAHGRYHHRHHHNASGMLGPGLIHMLKSAHRSRSGLYICAGCVVRETAAGIVAVSADNANRLVGAIDALVEAGFRGPVHCAAPYGTHVRNSLHHTGDACDMAQTGWGRSSAHIMYHASMILARFGVNDGCSFGDCGHISVGSREAHVGRYRHYASRRHRYASAQ